MYYRFQNLWLLLCCLLLSGFGTAQPIRAQEPPQDEVPLAPKQVRTGEIYRIRVENSLYGSVAISTDGGRHYTLVGRVVRPATSVSVDRGANEPGTVLRSTGDGVSFSVTFGQALRLRPAPALNLPPNASRQNSGANADPSAIVTNIAPHTGLFHFEDLPLPDGTHARMEINSRLLQPFPTLYTPTSDDIFVFLVTDRDLNFQIQKEIRSALPKPPSRGQEVQPADGASDPPLPAWATIEAIRARIALLGDDYLRDSLARARQENRTLVDGTLKLKAKLPTNEPDPIAFVTYAIDGQFVATQNVAPFDFELDTRKIADGEHVIEVRGLNRNTRLISLKRSLITVWNHDNKENK